MTTFQRSTMVDGSTVLRVVLKICKICACFPPFARVPAPSVRGHLAGYLHTTFTGLLLQGTPTGSARWVFVFPVRTPDPSSPPPAPSRVATNSTQRTINSHTTQLTTLYTTQHTQLNSHNSTYTNQLTQSTHNSTQSSRSMSVAAPSLRCS